MKIGIIGGGLTGLAAAHALSGMHDVDVFEKRSRIGGCLSSYQQGHYWIEQYYHHCFSGDVHLISLLNALKLSGILEWFRATTGYYVNNTVYPLTTPFQILKYPHMSLADKVKLAWLTLNSRTMDVKGLDSVPAQEFIVKTLGEPAYASFFEPLLNSKFGENSTHVSAAWLLSRIAIRSNRGLSGERLGYLKGGFFQLIDALDRSITMNGGVIMRKSPVSAIHRTNGSWEINGTRYDTVLSTIPPQELQKIGGPQTQKIPYQGAACMTIGLEQEVSDGIYWLNMKDAAPYGAVVAHTNFVPHQRYGEHIVYLASYFSGVLPQNLEREMLSDFCRRFSVRESEIHWTRMAVDPFAGPVYTTGYRSLIPEYEQHGLFMAGMFSLTNYPERSMEGSVRAAHEVAERIMKGPAHG